MDIGNVRGIVLAVHSCTECYQVGLKMLGPMQCPFFKEDRKEKRDLCLFEGNIDFKLEGDYRSNVPAKCKILHFSRHFNSENARSLDRRLNKIYDLENESVLLKLKQLAVKYGNAEAEAENSKEKIDDLVETGKEMEDTIKYLLRELRIEEGKVNYYRTNHKELLCVWSVSLLLTLFVSGILDISGILPTSIGIHIVAGISFLSSLLMYKYREVLKEMLHNAW